MTSAVLLTITLTLGSWHADRNRHFNESNPGVGVELACDGRHLAFGYYFNSSWRHSVYAVVGIETPQRWGLSVGAEVGVATGYRYPVIPLAFPYLRAGTRHAGVKINVLPTLRPIVGVQAWVRF